MRALCGRSGVLEPTRIPRRGGACHLRLVPRLSGLPLQRRHCAGPPQLCWLSGPTGAPRWRRIEVQYCLSLGPWPGGPYCSGLRLRTVLSLRYAKWMAFSGRPAGRPVSAPLHERAAPPPGGLAPARGPRLAATHPGPVGQDPVLSPRARGAAAGDLRPGARAATRRSASRARGPGPGSPLLRPAPSTVRRARGPAGPAASAAAGSLQPSLGDWRGTCPALPGLRHAGPTPWGAEGGRVLLSLAHPLGDPIDLLGRAAPPPGALRPGARPAPRRSALGPWTGTASSSPLLPLATHNVRRARGPAGPAAPARRNPRCGDGRGTCPALPGLRQAGPSPWGGAEGGRVPPSRLPAWRWWCGSPSP